MAVWSEVKRTDLVDNRRFDADYFKPEYIELEKTIKNLHGRKLKYDTRLVKCGPFGSIIKNETYKSKGVIVARPFNIHDMQFEYDNLAFISEIDFKNKNLISCADRDIFFARVGDVKVGIIQKISDLLVTISPNIVLLRLDQKNLRAEYTTVFFNTNYGLKQIIRAQKVVAQPTISTSLLNSLFVYNPGAEIQNEISDIFNKAISLKDSAKELYIEAEKLLEKELGLGELVLEKPKSYETKFSEIVGSGRTDADHYQLQYKQTKDLIKNYKNGYQHLLQIVDSLSPNYNPHKSPSLSFRYVELSNINPLLGRIEGCKIVDGMSAPSRAKRKVSTGDIIASAVVGSIDKAGIVDQYMEGALASTGFFHFRTKGASPYYLLLLVRSKIIKTQLLQESTGGILSAVPDHKLKNIIVPAIPSTVQDKLHSLLHDSHLAKRESDILLKNAKKRIEDLIEGVS